ncbi:hypothetical protein D3C73_873450 [compost metagenome]
MQDCSEQNMESVGEVADAGARSSASWARAGSDTPVSRTVAKLRSISFIFMIQFPLGDETG